MKKIVILVLVQILFCTLIYAGGIVPPRQDPNNPVWVKGEILVKFKDDVELQIISNRAILETGIKSLNELNSKWQVSEMEKIFKTEEKRAETKTIKTYTGEIIEVPQLFNIYKMKIPVNTDIEKAVEDFEKNPNVEYAEPNYIARICIIPDDPSFSNQWGLHNTGQYHLADADIDAPEAWEIETGDTTVVIGIIDTGVDYGHPDLADNIISTGYDFVNNDDDAMDDNGHGSHVAGIAAATTNNALGIAGVAWNCKILPVKVLQSNGYGTYSDVASGVNYAANNNAKVINLSLGGYTESYTLRDALENAYTTSVIVAAAGNHIPPLDIPFYPAAWSFVIGVGASDVLYDNINEIWYEGRAVFSNYGINADLYAPGVNIYSTIPLFHPHTYSYASWNGTSMAAPFVTGTVALIRSYYSDWSNELIHGQLIYSSDGIVGGIRLNAHRTLIEIPEPQLSLYSHTIIDTLPGCDQDGIADAGETVEMVFDIQNTWGQAYNVEAILSYHSYEDTCFVTIIDSIATFGSVSPYAHVNNETNPFKFYVKSSTPNNTDVYFDYEITCDEGYSFAGTFFITTQRGIEIGGIISENTTWSNDYLYIVTANTLVQQGVTLTIEPGTRMQFCADKYLRIDGCLVAIGTEDSIITFTSNAQNPAPGDWEDVRFYDNSVNAVFDVNGNYLSGSIMKYTELEFGSNVISISNASPYIANNYLNNNKGVYDGIIEIFGNEAVRIEYNWLIENDITPYGDAIRCEGNNSDNLLYKNKIESNLCWGLSISFGIAEKNIIRGNQTGIYIGSGAIGIYNNICHNKYRGVDNSGTFNNNNIFSNGSYYNSLRAGGFQGPGITTYNNIISNHHLQNDIYEVIGHYQINPHNNYWGTTNQDSIDAWIWDYYDDFDLNIVDYDPFETIPIVDAPGFLYQVEFNPPPPIGCEVDTFNLIFSKPMDISIQPYITFGVCEPYTQHIIEGAWV
ncbi:MAG: S8 family serine peptidase, partial [Candidatus Cloacimonetes bacterium]|nr:S8 family serine peptidase [Candidatus Cloacimonadota bacterium]